MLDGAVWFLQAAPPTDGPKVSDASGSATSVQQRRPARSTRQAALAEVFCLGRDGENKKSKIVGNFILMFV